jgi:hypothetical protein
MPAPSIGRIVHFVSEREPYVESPAMITMTENDFIPHPQSPVEQVSNERNVHLMVSGVHNTYKRMDVMQDPTESGNTPGTWHWYEDCPQYANVPFKAEVADGWRIVAEQSNVD